MALPMAVVMLRASRGDAGARETRRYWSNFVEVRRDAAAAFATLAMNEANLEVLSQAGALGALLALVAVGSGRNDAQVHRDAASALSNLVTLDDIKLRLLKAPDGARAPARAPACIHVLMLNLPVRRADTRSRHHQHRHHDHHCHGHHRALLSFAAHRPSLPQVSTPFST